MHKIEDQDVPEMMRMLVAMKNESPVYNIDPTNIKHTRDILQALRTSEKFIGVIEPDKGLMLGMLGYAWYAPVLEATEMALYVHKEYRGSLVSVHLIKEFERIATELGASRINVGASTGVNDRSVEKLYTRLGYHYRGNGLTKLIGMI